MSLEVSYSTESPYSAFPESEAEGYVDFQPVGQLSCRCFVAEACGIGADSTEDQFSVGAGSHSCALRATQAIN